MTSRRTSPLTVVALVVALLSLLVAASATSYAAGLKRNSVGTVQLKPGAVTSVKIKDGAVTGADVRDGALGGADLRDGSVGGADLAQGSVGLADLAPAAVPPRSVVLERDVTDTGGTLELLRNADFRVTVDCDAEDNYLTFRVTDPADGSTTEFRGTSTFQSSAARSTQVEFGNVLALAAGERVEMTNAFAMFEGIVRSSSGRTLRLSVALRMGTIPATDVCSVRLVATPVA